MTETSQTIELLQGILTEMKGMRGDIDGLKTEQVKTNEKLERVEIRLESSENQQKETNKRLESLEIGQQGMREDIQSLKSEQKETNVRLNRIDEGMMRLNETQVEHTQAILALSGEQKLLRKDYNDKFDKFAEHIINGISEIVSRESREFRAEMRTKFYDIEKRVETLEQRT